MQISGHVRRFDEIKYKSFFIEDDELFKIYNQIWRKVSISIKKELDSQSVYNKKI